MFNKKMELLYKAPGREKHQNLPEILDEIMLRLERLEYNIEQLQKS